MTRFLAVATVLLLLAAAPAADAQPRPRRSLSATEAADRCGGSNPEILQCVSGLLHREDARLNRAYKASMSRLPPPQQASLRNAQRRWIRDRDAECAYDESDLGMASIYATLCDLRLTEWRAEELERNGRRSR